MNEKKLAAIMAAVNAYLEEEARVVIPSPKPLFIFSPWKVFGLQELMRGRTSMQQKTR